MAYQIQALIIVVAMTMISVETYKIKRDIVFSNADDTFYRKSRPRNFFLNQPFVDKTIGLQTSSIIPIRDRIVSQRALRDVLLKDRVVYSSGFPTFRHRPMSKQNSFVTTFRDKPLFKDVMLKNREIRGEQAVLRDNPLEGQSLTPEEIFEGQASTYKSQAPFKELFTTGTSFKNLFHGQLSSAEQPSFQKQATFVESPSISSSIEFYRDNYIKPIDSYEQYKDIPTSFDEKPTKYNNYMPKLSSMPSSTPLIKHGNNRAMSSVFSGMAEAHSSEASKTELGPTLTSASNCTSVDSSPTTVPSTSVSTNQSSIVGHILTSLTTKPSSPVMATSIASSARNIAEPIYFHATKYGAVAPSLPTVNELNSDMHVYPLSHTLKNSLKINEDDFKFLETPKNFKTQSSILNYILPEEHKSEQKGIQNSFADYALVKLKYDWPLQQFSQSEASSDCAPLSLNGKTKLILPNIPVAPMSWPIEMKNDISTMLPLKSIITPDATTRNKLPLDTDLPVDFTASIPNNLTSDTPNGISGSITDSISTGIPGGMITDIPANIPTLNLGQSLHHVEQLRQTQEARNSWYPTGLQLQFGDGINYDLHTGNPVTKPMKPWVAKVGLTSPKLPQPHAPAFAKIEAGYLL